MSTPDHGLNQRPATITELVERALKNNPLEHHLDIAEQYRRDARDYYCRGPRERFHLLRSRRCVGVGIVAYAPGVLGFIEH